MVFAIAAVAMAVLVAGPVHASCPVLLNGSIPLTGSGVNLTSVSTLTVNVTGTETSRLLNAVAIEPISSLTATDFSLDVSGVVYGLEPVVVKVTLQQVGTGRVAVVVDVSKKVSTTAGSNSTSSAAGALTASSLVSVAASAMVAAASVGGDRPTVMAAVAVAGLMAMPWSPVALVQAAANTSADCQASNIKVKITMPSGWGGLVGSGGDPNVVQFFVSAAPTKLPTKLPTQAPTFHDYGYSYYVVFGTAGTYSGNLGSRTAANNICKAEAFAINQCCQDAVAILSFDAQDDVAGLADKYALNKAHPIKGYNTATFITYTLANNWAGFLSGPLLQSYSTNSAVFTSVTTYWTGTDASGHVTTSCTGWNTSSALVSGIVGQGSTTNYLSTGGTLNCGQTAKFTCLGMGCALSGC